MEFLTLGRSTLRVSRIGFGCAAIGGYDYGPVDDRESIAAIHRAIDLGINLFDTAAVYGLGHSEEVLGRALAGRRQAVVLATKFGVEWDANGRTRRNASADRIAVALEGSLRRLKADRIDLYQLHWPDGRTPIGDTLGALERLQEVGKIGAIGLCNVGADVVARAQQQARVETIQLPYNLVERQHEACFVNCRDQYAMGLLSYNSLAHGFLTGKYPGKTRFAETDLRARNAGIDGLARLVAEHTHHIRAIALRYGRTPAQVVIRWATQQLPSLVALVGVKSTSQAEENSAAVGWALAGEDLAAINSLNRSSR